MKRIATIIIAVTLFSPATFAQTRRRSSTKPRTPGTTTAKAAEVVRGGAVKVTDQIKNLTRFLYLLGGVAQGIEAADAAARRKEASPSIIEQTRLSKLKVRSSLVIVREGLDRLELDFRTTPELNRYYTKLAGVAAGAARAEEQAAADQFDRSGRTLLEVVNQLADVLLAMR